MKESHCSGDQVLQAATQKFQWLEQKLSAFKSELRACTGELEKVKESQRQVREALRRDQQLMATHAQIRSEQERREYALLAMLSHELRNPLASMQSAVEMFQLQSEQLDDRLQWATDVLARQLRWLRRLADELLDASQLVAGRVSLDNGKVDIGQVVSHAVEMVRPLLAERCQTLALSLPRGPVWVDGDALRLQQVVENLLRNAATYTKEGGQIWLSAERQTDQIELKVRDSGMGLVKETQERISDLFSQGERALDRFQGGLGLGLTMVKKLVHMHGGSVAAFSEGLGQGSEFTVRLPVAHEGASEPDPTSPAAGEPQALKQRILVVEDHCDVADAFAMLLRAMGCEVRVVGDGEAALEAADCFRPEVAFIDIGLPKMDGYEVARRLRATFTKQPVLLVALTAYGQKEDVRRAHQAGFDHHLLKPAKLVDIKNVIRTHRKARPWPSSRVAERLEEVAKKPQ